MAHNELFEKGLKTRKQVLGAEYVDANLSGLRCLHDDVSTSRYGIGLGLRVLVAQMRSADRVRRCLLLGEDRTYRGHHETDAFGTTRTSWNVRCSAAIRGQSRH